MPIVPGPAEGFLHAVGRGAIGDQGNRLPGTDALGNGHREVGRLYHEHGGLNLYGGASAPLCRERVGSRGPWGDAQGCHIDIQGAVLRRLPAVGHPRFRIGEKQGDGIAQTDGRIDRNGGLGRLQHHYRDRFGAWAAPLRHFDGIGSCEIRHYGRLLTFGTGDVLFRRPFYFALSVEAGLELYIFPQANFGPFGYDGDIFGFDDRYENPLGVDTAPIFTDTVVDGAVHGTDDHVPQRIGRFKPLVGIPGMFDTWIEVRLESLRLERYRFPLAVGIFFRICGDSPLKGQGIHFDKNGILNDAAPAAERRIIRSRHFGADLYDECSGVAERFIGSTPDQAFRVVGTGDGANLELAAQAEFDRIGLQDIHLRRFDRDGHVFAHLATFDIQDSRIRGSHLGACGDA